MKYIYLSVCCLLLISCNEQRGQKFKEVNTSNTEKRDSIITDGADTIIIDKVNDVVVASDIIESVSYIPLETTKESLFDYCTGLTFYKDKIYLIDKVMAETVLIFDTNGHFLKRVGDKGEAPNEFSLLKGMSIDQNKDQLVMYDNQKRKMVYYTLDGKYIKNVDVNFKFHGQYAVLPSGMTVSATVKSDYNTHLGDLDEYRLLYTDSLGQITKTDFRWDDNRQLPIYYEAMLDTENGILYYPPYTNTLYSVTDTVVSAKYVVEYKKYPQIKRGH